jgi:hypothetical protein
LIDHFSQPSKTKGKIIFPLIIVLKFWNGKSFRIEL